VGPSTAHTNLFLRNSLSPLQNRHTAMNSALFSLVCAAVIAGLFYLDREKVPRVSQAVWIPGVWLGIVGSRPVSQWFGITVTGNELGSEGSPVDAAVFAFLLALAIGVVIRRSTRARTLLRANWPLIAYFSVCLISIAWSSHPDIALKRWTKAIGDLLIALVLATEREPVIALRRLVSRLGMLIFPTSLLFIRYFGDLGRGYTSDGIPMNTGVTTNKNSLGLIVLIISLITLWNFRSLFIHKDAPHRRRRLLAQGFLLALGITLFLMADCSTCKACFLLGTLLVIALNLRMFKRRRVRVHALCLTLLIAAGAALLMGGKGEVASALGRQSSLSGRTDLWAALIPAAPNALIGAGFESFWSTPNVDIAKATLMSWGWSPHVMKALNEAHDGYVEIYLQLGWLGICLILFVLFSGYRRASRAYQRDFELGALFVACVSMTAVYSITEAGFRTLCPSWILFLIAVVYASAVDAGLFGCEPNAVSARSRITPATEFDLLPAELEPARAFHTTSTHT
jgi:exopolysaccharide production protein ExoQ